MTKKIAVLIILGLLCTGMGTTSGLSPDMTQRDRLFRAVIIDGSDNVYQVQNLSVDGSTYLPARTGTAEASIDFGKVSKVRFYLQDDEVLAKVIFIDDQEMDFYIKPGTTFLGQTDWGRISFQAGDIKEISFR